MVEINIEKLLKEKNKSKYWLCNKMKITNNNLNKVAKNKTKSISLRYLEDFCKYLECSPSELITIKFD